MFLDLYPEMYQKGYPNRGRETSQNPSELHLWLQRAALESAGEPKATEMELKSAKMTPRVPEIYVLGQNWCLK